MAQRTKKATAEKAKPPVRRSAAAKVTAPAARRTSAKTLTAAVAPAKAGRTLATVKAAPAARRPGARYLVVVESPAKAKTIKKYLGAGYTVKASVGHIKDLPKSKMGVDVEHGFKPEYVVIKSKEKALGDPLNADLKAAADFYTHVVGWTAKDAGMPDVAYQIASTGSTMANTATAWIPAPRSPCVSPSTVKLAARRSTSPERARSSRPISMRRRRCARPRCSTCSARWSTTRSR